MGSCWEEIGKRLKGAGADEGAEGTADVNTARLGSNPTTRAARESMKKQEADVYFNQPPDQSNQRHGCTLTPFSGS